MASRRGRVTASVPLLAAVPATVTCVNSSAGQAVCSGTSTGFLAGLGVILFIYLALAVVGIVAAVKVVTKAGFSGWWVLIAFVPIVGTIFVLIFAFSTWPVTREVQRLRAELAAARGYGGFAGTARPAAPGPGPGRGPEGSSNLVPAGSSGSTATQATAGPDALASFGQFLHGGPVGPSLSPAVTPVPTAAGPEATNLPPAGWYPSPGGVPGQQRYWDGAAWTDRER